MNNTFRAFRNRNYTLYFTGQSISQIGTQMQATGISWVIYTITHSTFMLGVSIFASLFPRFLLSLLGGIIADRHNRYHIMLITQIASMIQASLLAILTFTNHYLVWELLSLNVLLGVINAFDSPARQPLVHEMITDKADLPNAVAFNSSMVNLARITGPALSGIILARFGAGTCFLLNALSFIAVIGSLLLMKLPAPSHKPPIKKGIANELTDGFVYLKSTPTLSIILLIVGLLSLLAFPYDTLLPEFAKVVFKGDATTFGYIGSFIGLGAIGGTLFLATIKPEADLRKVLLVNIIILGIGLILFSHISYFPLALAFGTSLGFGAMTLTTICLTIIQAHTSAPMRGRVISYLIMVMAGMLPLGSLLIGGVSQKIGAPNTLLSQGIISLIIAGFVAAFLKKEQLKQEDIGQLEVAEDAAVEGI